MTRATNDRAGGDHRDEVPDPQGRVFGIPYDLRRPTVARVRARFWNAADHRLMTPKSFGAGWDLNFYWIAHPFDYLSNRVPKAS